MYSGKKAQHDFPKMRGGGAKAVWNFSKNSSVLEEVGFPKRGVTISTFPSFQPQPCIALPQKAQLWHLYSLFAF